MNPLLQQVGHEIVERDYFLDPETDDMFYSDELLDGMIVLIESDGRASIDPAYDNPIYVPMRLVKNRWCEVSKLRIEGDNVSFIGLYVDGDKQVRTHNKCIGWLVKKDSIPPEHFGVKGSVVDPELLKVNMKDMVEKLRTGNSARY